MMRSILFTVFIFLTSVTICFSLRCMECTNLAAPTDCGTITECEPDSYCFLESYITLDGKTLYNSGCRAKQRCRAHTRSLPQDTSTAEIDTRDLSDLKVCEECCHDRDFCNHDGCNFTGTARPLRGPHCFDCAVQSDANMCRSIVTCDIADMCGLNHDVRLDGEFKTSCITKSQCGGIHQAVFSLPFQTIIGKRDARYTPLASCCDEDFCNDHRYNQNTTGGHQVNVDGIWSTWSQWSVCTQTCGSNSTQQRIRWCNSPAPQGNGTPCPGSASEDKLCPVVPCPVDGLWSQWSAWSVCPATCGTGSEQTRHRKCDSPAPQHGGQNCSGLDFDKQSCNTTPCPVDGLWSQWTAWSVCPATCGTGSEQTRNRKCDSPAPQHGGQNCSGLHFDKQSCNTTTCPVDGSWSTWVTWSNCSKTCGPGSVRHRHRKCNSPAPQHGGSHCAGAKHQRDNCTEIPCPVHGHWSAWKAWSECPKLCNTERHQYRIRSCDNPAPQFHGHSCVGAPSETRLCAPLTCRVDGAWSNWEPWSTCTVTCGTTGMHLRIRKCNNPPPQHNGTDCQGGGTQVRDCQGLSPCIVDGQWSLWSQWSSCTTTCGLSGQMIRSRDCSSPAPLNGGKTCAGDRLQLDACNRIDCPVDGQWSDWQDWSVCTATCGSQSTRVRTRSCDNPAPRHHGKNCTGDSRQLENCNVLDCPVDGHWSLWSKWTSCTASCGPLAIKLRVRQCVGPLHGGQPCTGSAQETAQCTVPSC